MTVETAAEKAKAGMEAGFFYPGGKCWFRTSDLSRVRRSLYP